MSSKKQTDRYVELQQTLETLPHISPPQVAQWVELQRSIDQTRDYLIRAVPQAQFSIDEAQKILAQRTYTLVFFGGTGVGKSTLINALLGRNLLPTGAVTAVTGTIVYIEQAKEGEAESLTLNYWSRDEFAERVRRLCQLAELDSFDITNDGEREQAATDIKQIIEDSKDNAKTERDEYLEILLDCIASYDNNKELFKAGTPLPQSLALENEDSYKHLREDGFKGSNQRQIRLIKSATFKIHPKTGMPSLLMNGYLRIVDVPGLGAGMKLHEAITLEEMKREDAMIVLVTDAGRQRVDELKSLSAVNWIKENRLFGLSGGDLDEAASKIFLAVNGANIRQAFDRLNSGLPEAELEVKEVTRYIAPNYWERYRDRGLNRPYFLVMAPPALYVQDPENAPDEFASETERILKTFKDQLGNVNLGDPLDTDTKEALLKLSEVPLLRERLVTFIKTERVRSQLREASTRIRNALQSLRFYYEKQLAARGVHPPFANSWEQLQERRYENVLRRQNKELPRAFHNALLELSSRTNSDDRFRTLLRPTFNGVKGMVQDAIQREVETLLDSYGTEHWDDRDVTYDNLVWGTSGIEVPIKRILYQVELVMQDSVSQFMPQMANVIADELQRTLEAHEIYARLERASYGQEYTYSLPGNGGVSLNEAYEAVVNRVGANFRHVCQQATMYELMKPERSINHKLEAGEQELALPSNERLLDVALHGVDAVRREIVASMPAAHATEEATAVAEPEEEIQINILDVPATPEADIAISFPGDNGPAAPADLEMSYADKLDNISVKINRIFGEIINDLFSDDELMPRLRRLFWLEATKAERDFNNHIVKPMLKNHDRKLQEPELREAMAVDLESVSDLEELMRVWEGLEKLETSLAI
ncbi:MAG: dynamin family protein [Ardenticatenaceae bacterium]|nr:dynamin family protein [Anaerolineales bacterium]MCB8921711.1 dynamin family protein [Ardenticatenaceae bacterium]MCB8990770.1 dynamin family protein [Ardenticatenaceae bacterium]MCB9003257.1 dynamin family protein [Ardenticatenaceae bacterium]